MTSRDAALKVYLDHSLNAAKAAVDRLEERSSEGKWWTAVKHGKTLIRYVRTCLDEPQHWLCTISGISALVAIDRAEEALKWAMSATVADQGFRQQCLLDLCDDSGRAVVCGIIARRDGNIELVQLWQIVNHLCDTLVALPRAQQKHYTHTICDRPRRLSFLKERMKGAAGDETCFELWQCVELQCRRACALKSVATKITAYEALVSLQPSGLANRYFTLERQACRAIEMYERAAEYQSIARTCQHEGVLALYNRAVASFRTAAAEALRPEQTPDPEKTVKKARDLAQWANELHKLLPSLRSVQALVTNVSPKVRTGSSARDLGAGLDTGLPSLSSVVMALEAKFQNIISAVEAYANGVTAQQTKEDAEYVSALVGSFPKTFEADWRAAGYYSERQQAISCAAESPVHIVELQCWSLAAQSMGTLLEMSLRVPSDRDFRSPAEVTSAVLFCRQRASHAANLAEQLRQDTLGYWHNVRRCGDATSPAALAVASLWRKVTNVSLALAHDNLDALQASRDNKAYELHLRSEKVERMGTYITSGAELARLMESPQAPVSCECPEEDFGATGTYFALLRATVAHLGAFIDADRAKDASSPPPQEEARDVRLLRGAHRDITRFLMCAHVLRGIQTSAAGADALQAAAAVVGMVLPATMLNAAPASDPTAETVTLTRNLLWCSDLLLKPVDASSDTDGGQASAVAAVERYLRRLSEHVQIGENQTMTWTAFAQALCDAHLCEARAHLDGNFKQASLFSATARMRANALAMFRKQQRTSLRMDLRLNVADRLQHVAMKLTDPTAPYVRAAYSSHALVAEHKEKLKGIVVMCQTWAEAKALLQSRGKGGNTSAHTECAECCRRTVRLVDAAVEARFEQLDLTLLKRQKSSSYVNTLRARFYSQRDAAECYLSAARLIAAEDVERARLWRRAAEAYEEVLLQIATEGYGKESEVYRVASSYHSAAKAVKIGSTDSSAAWVQCAEKYHAIWKLAPHGACAPPNVPESREVAECLRMIAEALGQHPGNPALVEYWRARLEPLLVLEECARCGSAGAEASECTTSGEMEGTGDAAGRSSDAEVRERRAEAARAQLEAHKREPLPEPLLPPPPPRTAVVLRPETCKT